MTTQLTIVARIEAKPEHTERVRSALIKLLEPTRNEDACINYDLHQDINNPSLFLLYENWKSRELWLAHMETQHIKAYAAATEGAVDNFTVNEMSITG
ncbi:putative quinol monooxygenase [Amphritea japonica]|nr:putative quinol monooxygenase [Amphritea japonica]